MLMKNVIPIKVVPKEVVPYTIELYVNKIGSSRHAGRDREAMRNVIENVRAQGHKAHDEAGVCFTSRYLLTTEDTIEAQDKQTSGEVEFVVFRSQGELHVTAGSDHSDRTLIDMWTLFSGKVHDTAKAKQMTPAVMATEAWLYEDVRRHWDKLVLRSWITLEGVLVPYQEYELAILLDYEYYRAKCPWLGEEGSVLFSGSSGLLESIPENVFKGQADLRGVYMPQDFHFEMYDPVLNRTISHTYKVLAIEESGLLSL